MSEKGTDILVIEDDPNIAGVLCDFLRERGYTVTTASDGQRALALYERYGARLVLLDIMLPGVDGFEILSRIRRRDNTPVIIASARDAKEDKLCGLLGGADDYIEKPYDIDILLAKIDGIFKRRYGTDEQIFGELRIDRAGQTVYLCGEKKVLTAKEYELLLLLTENQGKVLTKEYLFHEVWGIDSDSESQTLTVHIKWLRDKLERDPRKPEHILTVWGVGYKFV